MKITNYNASNQPPSENGLPPKNRWAQIPHTKISKDVPSGPLRVGERRPKFKAKQISIKASSKIIRSIESFLKKKDVKIQDAQSKEKDGSLTAVSLEPATPLTGMRKEDLSSDYRSQAYNIMQSKAPFPEMSEEMNLLVQKAAPESFAKLKALIDQHPALLQQLKEKGWAGLKKELKEGMERNDPIRAACVQGVIDLLLETMKAMGFDPPGNHSASGTPGWNSDIDTPYFAPKGMPQAMQMIEKSMFDMVMFANFGRLPGFIFDTESYTQQAGGKYETQNHLETKEGEALFARIELTAALLQMLIETGGAETEAWKHFKEEQLASAKSHQNEAYETALIDAFADLEEMHQKIGEGIAETMQNQGLDPRNSGLRKLAMMGYKMAGIFEISREIDANQQLLDKLNREKNPNEAEQRDFLRVKIAQLDLVRTSFYDEGYLTQGAFRKVCFLYAGQQHQRKIELQQSLIRHHYHAQIAQSIPIKDMTPWIGGYHLHRTHQKIATAQENFSSMLENLVMCLGHFARKTHEKTDENHQAALFETSKYSERVIQAAENLMNMIEASSPPQSGPSEKIRTLKNQIQELASIIAEQEKVKRANYLNYASTEAELLKALHVDEKKAQEEIEDMKQSIKRVLEVSEPEGIIGKAKLAEDIVPEDRYLVLFSKMVHQELIVDKGLDGKGMPYSDNPQVDLILKARCGFSPAHDSELYRQLLPYHQKSPQTTLEAQNLTTPESVTAFLGKLKAVANDVINLSIASLVVPSPQAELPAGLRLSQTWREAMEGD